MKRATQAAYVKDKPKFALTPIKEIANKPPNNGSINIISTFAGCGGSSLGYRYNGGTIRWANEVVDEARAVYEANASPYTIVDGRDIRTIDPLEVAYLVGGEVDILDGSPPCSSFLQQVSVTNFGERLNHTPQCPTFSAPMTSFTNTYGLLLILTLKCLSRKTSSALSPVPARVNTSDSFLRWKSVGIA